MKRLHSFVLKSFLGPFAFTFFVCMFILLMQFLWKYIDDLVGKGLDWYVIVEFMIYISATLVPMALPLSILLASIMTFGNMGENYELIALKAAGISLQRIMRPLVLLVVVISLGAFYFSNIVMPLASLKASTLFYDIKHQKPELILKEGIFTNDLTGFSIKVDKIDKKTGMMRNLLIYDHRQKKGNINVTVADSGLMYSSKDKKFMNLTLYSGTIFDEVKKKGYRHRKDHPSKRLKFSESKTIIALPGSELKRTDENVFKGGSYRMLNVKQLTQSCDSLTNKLRMEQNSFSIQLLSQHLFNKESRHNRTDSTKRIALMTDTLNADSLYNTLSPHEKLNVVGSALSFSRKAKKNISKQNDKFMRDEKYIRKYLNEWHRKFTLSFACLIFFFIGAPLGAIIRKGGLGMPVIVSVIFFIIYYIISMTGERFAKEGVLIPYQGMWISSLIVLPLGIILTYKATTDSSILNAESYINFLKKLNPFKKRGVK